MSKSVFYLEDFNYDSETKKIISCPQGNVCIESEFIFSKRYYYARFGAEQCGSCNFIKQCPVKIKNKYSIARIFKKSESTKSESLQKKPKDNKAYVDNLNKNNNLINKPLEEILRATVEMEIGSISNAKKQRGKKFEDGVISYDGDYLESNSIFGETWYSHGYGKAYYEDASIEYEGYFVYGCPHGHGKYYYRNGQVKWEGTFEGIPGLGDAWIEAFTTAEGYSDRKGRIKYGKRFDTSGKLEYEGEFKLGIPNGYGKLYDDNQILIFVGEFKNGKPIGENKLKQMAQKESKIYYEISNKSKNQNVNDDFIIEESGLKYIGESDEVIVPESIDGKIIDKIAPEGFVRKRVKRVVLPNTIKVIGRSSFADCSELTNIIIPDSVTNIEAWAFGTCSSLSRIELSDNIIEIGSHAFDECYNLEYIKLPERINYIGAYAFCETALKKVILPKNIKYLANSLFYDCRYLKEVVLQEGLETIGTWTFGNCTELSKINLPESIKTISDLAFDNCTDLREIRIPESLNEMSENSFNNCVNLRNIETDDINKKIIKFNIQKRIAEGFGLSGDESKYKDEYDTIYNLLLRSIGRGFNVIPVHKDEKSQQQIYEDILNEGVDLKREGKYEEAKEKYVEAIRMGCKNPTAYYNLGKILYILGEFEASTRSYQTSFELGRDPYNVLVHLGHAILDKDFRNGKYESVISFYERGINPYLIKKYIGNEDKLIRILQNQPSKELMDEYDNKCIDVAKKYLNI